ncbi:hypothetical protein BKA83DRAFT_511978 [Pisolithus microcarpus]|nr:hypothetical protein BKA83DRAFT_511978 [Pisolithus microcarpus]
MQHQVPPRRRTRYAGYCRILFSDVAAVFSASSSKTCAIFFLRYRSFSSPLFPSYPAHVLLLVESHRRTVPFIHRISPFLATHQHDPIVLEDKTSYGETTSGISLSSQNMRQTPRSSPASVFRAFFAVLGRRLPTPSSAHSCHSLASSLPVFWNVMLVLFVPQVPPCPCGRSKMARTRTIQDPHPFAIRPLGSNSSQPSDWSPMNARKGKSALILASPVLASLETSRPYFAYDDPSSISIARTELLHLPNTSWTRVRCMPYPRPSVLSLSKYPSYPLLSPPLSNSPSPFPNRHVYDWFSFIFHPDRDGITCASLV